MVEPLETIESAAKILSLNPWTIRPYVRQGKIRPVLWRTMGFEGVPEAHQLMKDNKHLGKISILVGAPEEGLGRTIEGAGAIHAEVGA